MGQIYKGIEEGIKLYTVEEIDKIVKENEERLIEYCKELEIEYADSGRYSAYETMRVLFDLRDFELHMQVEGQGIAQEIIKGIEEGYVIQVYRFETGRLDDMAFETLEFEDDCEAAELYSMYRDGELTEEEYDERYEVIQTWIDNYIDSYLEETVGIEIDYLYPVEKEDHYGSWYEN